MHPIVPITSRRARSVFVAIALVSLALPLRAADVAPTVAAPAAALAVASLFPSNGATNICPDTPLRLTFTSAPVPGSAGAIRIVDAADNSVVETIDMGSPTAVKTIGGLPNYKYYPVIVDGNAATIHPRTGALGYGRTYYVTIDAGAFAGGAGLAGPAAWRFTTKAAAPAPGTANLTVAADGTGDFCTVQGALDFIPDGNTAPTTIRLRRGIYTEIVFFTNKHEIALVGDDRRECVITYANNDRFNPSSGNPFAGTSPDPSSVLPQKQGGNIYHRGVFLAHRVEGLTLANLTIRNTTPHGGSQAEAVILNGTPTARAILANVDLASFQDTLQINGQAYLRDCRFEGDVDFMWGTGPCFFENCTAYSVRSKAYYTQVRNPATNHGYVYLGCTFDGAPGVVDNFLSRIQPGRFPASEVVLIDCVLGPAVGAVGWQFQAASTGSSAGTASDTSRVHFWEFNSRTADGRPVDVSQRLAGSRRLEEAGDAAVLADYRNPVFVLGGGWNPRAAAIFAAPAATAK